MIKKFFTGVINERGRISYGNHTQRYSVVSEQSRPPFNASHRHILHHTPYLVVGIARKCLCFGQHKELRRQTNVTSMCPLTTKTHYNFHPNSADLRT